MARWDEILSLPVQNPPTLEFSAADLVWSKVEGWCNKKDRVAVIPFARVDDFVRGESANKECLTKFHVAARRKRREKANFKPKVDGILEYILYWCSFGPDDNRVGGSRRPSRTHFAPKKKNSGRPNTKRGYTCHFIVKRLIVEPSVALLVYNSFKHVDKKGLPCHGPEDKMAAGTRAMFAPHISEDLHLRVLSLLYVGVSVETIMQRHSESVERQGGPCNRDDLLTHRHVRSQERNIRRSTYELDSDDAVSVSLWVENHQSSIFFYEDFSETDPFTLGIQTDWQLQQMIRFGNHSLIASDSRFGTNKLKYPVHSLLVFNQDNKAIPVAWIVNPKSASSDTYKWMRALYNRVQAKDPSWKLAGFIVDDPQAEVLTIRDVFHCSVLISFWRVRHAWHKNLVSKCSEEEMRATIARRLHQAVDIICQRRGTDGLFVDFMEDFVDASDFVDYFKATWYPRIGKWTTALQSLPLASQETCAAMEFYQALLDMLHMRPHDSLIRDHAVSLAAFVRNQLSGPNSESSNSTMDHTALADKDLVLVDEGPVSEEAHNGNSCVDEHVAVTTEMRSPVACGNGIYNEGCGEENTSEMDVDPSSICISPPGLHSVDEVVSSGVLSGSSQRPLVNTETEELLSADDALSNSSENEDDMLDEKATTKAWSRSRLDCLWGNHMQVESKLRVS